MVAPYRYVSYHSFEIPLYGSAVSAGFPSPADDHIEACLDLNDLIITNPPATFFVRASGDSMAGVGIFDGDFLVVDRSIPPRDNRVVVAAIDGELLVKIYREQASGIFLVAANRNYPMLKLDESQEVVFWGVVTTVIHRISVSTVRASQW